MRKKETLRRAEFVYLVADMDDGIGDDLINELNSWEGGKETKWVEYSVDSVGRIDSESSPRPADPTMMSLQDAAVQNATGFEVI